MKKLYGWTAALATLALSAPALAQAPQAVPQEAEKLYAEGVAAMIKKDYEAACPKFEEVTRMVPDGGGVRGDLADCYEKQGKLASAFRQFEIAEVLAKKDNRKDRLLAATKGIARVKPKVAMLIVEVPEAVRSTPDLVIRLDGDVLGEKQWGVPSPVDRGEHTLVASAKDHKSVTVRVDVAKDGTTTSTSLPALEPAPVAPPVVAPPPTSAAPAPQAPIVKDENAAARARTPLLIGGGALALGGLVTGGVALGLSFGKADERKKAEAVLSGRDAAERAAQGEAEMQNVALWGFVGGGAAALATGIFYFATRSRAKAPLSGAAFIGPDGPRIWLEGRF